MIQTNADGCITGNYFAEPISDRKEAQKILAEVLHGDSNAKLVEVKEDISND